MPLKELSWLYSNQERRYLGSSTTHARKLPLHQPGKRFKQVKQQSCCTIVVWLRLRIKTLGQKDTHTITQHTKCLLWSRFFVPKYLHQYQLDLFPPPSWSFPLAWVDRADGCVWEATLPRHQAVDPVLRGWSLPRRVHGRSPLITRITPRDHTEPALTPPPSHLPEYFVSLTWYHGHNF